MDKTTKTPIEPQDTKKWLQEAETAAAAQKALQIDTILILNKKQKRKNQQNAKAFLDRKAVLEKRAEKNKLWLAANYKE